MREISHLSKSNDTGYNSFAVTPLRVFVEVSDRYLWTLRPFAYLFNVYWSSLQPVVVAGYSKPSFRLPGNFMFHQINSVNYPAEKWSNGMIEFLRDQPDECFVLLLCDYWLSRTVDVGGVQTLFDYTLSRPNVLRMDLTADRLYAGGMFDLESWGHYDIIETPYGTPYQMSTQAGIWNKKLMLDLLVPDKSAWDVELHTQPPGNMRVLGTRQCPVRYANGILKGKIDDTQVQTIPDPHKQVVREMIEDARRDGDIP